MPRNHGPSRLRAWQLLRRFVVVEESMRPTLEPGDGLIALRSSTPKPGQLRVFPDPMLSTRYLVKRVGEVRESDSGTTFQALSDNAGAAGVTDSREFGMVPAAGSYRVVWKVSAARDS